MTVEMERKGGRAQSARIPSMDGPVESVTDRMLRNSQEGTTIAVMNLT
jgi:hypothetical protein